VKYYLYELVFKNKKKYIGISQDAKRRFIIHKAFARAGSRQAIHRAIRKYGEDSVRLKILVVGDKDYILEMEKKAIFILNTTSKNFGYNMSFGGEISPVAGIGHSKKSRKKMSISQKKRIRSSEEIYRWAQCNKGRKFSEEHKEKLKISATGRKLSKETKNKISESISKIISGENNPMFGKKHSADSIRKISEATSIQMKGNAYRLGKFHTEETKQKMRDAHEKRKAA